MNKVKCINGHFFDLDQTQVCMHCGAPAAKDESETTGGAVKTEEDKPKKKFSFWTKDKSKGKVEETPVSISTANGEVINPPTNVIPNSADIVPNPNSAYPKTEVLIKPPTDISAGQIRKEAEYKEVQTESLTQPKSASFEQQKAELKTEVLIHNYVQEKKEAFISEPKRTEQPKTEPMRQEPKMQDLDAIKTVSVYATESGEEPVTGWLVGMEGVYRGSSFSLKTGVNVIGRDVSAYVCLKKDTQVSRKCHATVLYEPKKKVFYLGEGENTMTYLNDELLSGKQKLNDRDMIEIGGGKYMFVPLCGENFDWD